MYRKRVNIVYLEFEHMEMYVTNQRQANRRRRHGDAASEQRRVNDGGHGRHVFTVSPSAASSEARYRCSVVDGNTTLGQTASSKWQQFVL